MIFDNDIAIIGMSGRFPDAENLEEYWNNLVGGKDSVSEHPLHQDLYHSELTDLEKGILSCQFGASIRTVDTFDPAFFGIAPVEGALIDPQERLFLQVAWEALQDAGWNPKEMSREARKIGVFVGVIWQDYQLIALEETLKGNPVVASSLLYSIANRVSYTFNLTGSSLSVDTACSSSLTALHLACQSIMLGEIRAAIVGGVNLNLHPMKYAFLNNYDFLSSEGKCRSYGEGGDGYVPGEGIGALVLKSLKEAIKDGDPIYAVIKGSAINHGGKTRGYTVPNPVLQSEVILSAIERAKINPREITYVEGHGTGTALGDPVEVRGLDIAYSQFTSDKQYCALGSVKSNIGHLEAAAGIASIIKVILQMQHKMLVPSLHSEVLNKNIDFSTTPFFVQRKLESWESDRPLLGAVSSFGAGGSYAHVILESYDKSRQIRPPLMPAPQKKYWIEQRTQRVGLKSFVHPLLGEKHSNPRGEIFYLGELNLSALPYLKDHRVYDYLVYPGACYVEMMLAAGVHGLGSNEIHLSNVSIEAALSFSGGKPIETQVLMTPLDSGYSVTIYTQNEEALWNCHAKGTVSVKGVMQDPAPVNIEEVKSHCTTVMTKEAFYKNIGALGMGLGNHFQTLNVVYVGSREALGEMRLSISAIGYQGHPALVDAAVQLLAVSPWHNEKGELYLPVGCDDVQLYAPLGDHLFAYCQETAETPEGRTGNITICIPSGKIVATLKGMHYRKTTEQALKQMFAHERSLCYELAWQPMALPVSAVLEIGNCLLISDSDIPAMRLKTAIEEKGAKCWVAASYDKQTIESLVAAEPVLKVLYLPSAALDDQTNQRQIIEPLLVIAKILIAAEALQRPSLWLITHGVYPLDPMPVNVTQAPLVGIQRCLLLEHPELTIRQIDLDPLAREEQKTEALLAELSGPENEWQVAYRKQIRYAARLLRLQKQEALALPSVPNFHLHISQKGMLETLNFSAITLPALKASDVAIEIQAVGLNFRDLLNALDLYPGDPGPLGSDGAGIVTEVGSEVSDLKVGDRVFGFSFGALASHAISSRDLLARIPESLHFAEAATIPTTFLTVHYGFHHLSKLRPGQKVLIHAASGGVGLSAIQLAQNAGAIIYATVGSQAKRLYLQRLGIAHIYDSRSLAFADQILRDTQGQGVDLVINSLSGEGFIEASLKACAANACFLEIGKRNIWTPQKLKAVRPDIAYHIIALDTLILEEPSKIKQLLAELVPQFASGKLKPLPTTIFSYRQALLAFRYMQQAKQIGKIVLTPEEMLLIDSQAAYLITGGLGALGLKMAEWLVAQGAKQLYLLGRRTPSPEAQAAIEHLHALGATITVVQLDVSDAVAVSDFMQQFGSIQPPLKGVIHAAGILDDDLFTDLDWSRFENVFAPKLLGAWNLHEATKTLPLDFFVLFSSIASVLGSAGQSNYAAANSFLDALAAYRQQQGLSALSVNWGPWAEKGMAAGLEQRHLAGGLVALKDKPALEALKTALTSHLAQVLIASVHWEQFLKKLQVKMPLLNALSVAAPTQEPHFKLLMRLRESTAQERSPLLRDYVRETVKRTLGLSGQAVLQDTQDFVAMGMDSLMAMELKNRLQKELGTEYTLPSTVAFDYASVNAMTDFLETQLKLKELPAISKPKRQEKAVGQEGQQPPSSTLQPEFTQWSLIPEWRPLPQDMNFAWFVLPYLEAPYITSSHFFEETIDKYRLQLAIQHLLNCTPLLSIELHPRRPDFRIQCVKPVQMTFIDLTAYAPQEQNAYIWADIKRSMCNRNYKDLPVFFVAYQLSHTKYYLQIYAAHYMDGSSLAIIKQSILDNYDRLKKGRSLQAYRADNDYLKVIGEEEIKINQRVAEKIEYFENYWKGKSNLYPVRKDLLDLSCEEAFLTRKKFSSPIFDGFKQFCAREQVPITLALGALASLSLNIFAAHQTTSTFYVMQSDRSEKNEAVGLLARNLAIHVSNSERLTLKEYILQLKERNRLLNMHSYPAALCYTHYNYKIPAGEKIKAWILKNYFKLKIPSSPWSNYLCKMNVKTVLFKPRVEENYFSLNLTVNPLIFKCDDLLDQFSILPTFFVKKQKSSFQLAFSIINEELFFHLESILKPQVQEKFFQILEDLIVYSLRDGGSLLTIKEIIDMHEYKG